MLLPDCRTPALELTISACEGNICFACNDVVKT